MLACFLFFAVQWEAELLYDPACPSVGLLVGRLVGRWLVGVHKFRMGVKLHLHAPIVALVNNQERRL